MTNHDVAVATPSDEVVDDDYERPDRSLAEQLVDRARADGRNLVGPGGLLSDLTKQILETGLEVEMDDHVGYAKHAVEGRNHGNSRNGARSKTVLTEIGPVDIEVSRDRVTASTRWRPLARRSAVGPAVWRRLLMATWKRSGCC